MATGQLTVTYRDCPGYPEYRVGDDGTIQSRRAPGAVWKTIHLRVKKNGYVYLQRNGSRSRKRICVPVHRLVLLAFVGPCPNGCEACHNDGNPTNNRLSNLRWDTSKANAADAARHGTVARGGHNGSTSLSDDAVLAIRTEYAAGGISQTALAHKHGVGQMTVSDIVRGKTWAHLS